MCSSFTWKIENKVQENWKENEKEKEVHFHEWGVRQRRAWVLQNAFITAMCFWPFRLAYSALIFNNTYFLFAFNNSSFEKQKSDKNVVSTRLCLLHLCTLLLC